MVYIVLYGCETWSFALREEHGLKVFNDRLQKRIFELNMEEITGSIIILDHQCTHFLESGSSDSIVYGYGLIDRVKEVRSPVEAK
jgi:hypothetical protein